MHVIGKLGCGTVALCAVFVLAVMGIGVYIGTQQADVEQVRYQATVEADYARAAQVRAQAELVESEASAYQTRRQADLLAYTVQMSEERQDELIGYVLTGKLDAQRNRQSVAIFAAGIAALAIAGLVIESYKDPVMLLLAKRKR